METDPYADYKKKRGPGPFVTCDSIVVKTALGSTASIGRHRPSDYDILLVKRRNDPYKGLLALPGGFMEPDDPSILDGALRELEEETSLVLSRKHFLESAVWDNPRRDPRARIIGVAHVFYCSADEAASVSAGDDAESADWYNLQDIVNLGASNLAFDHWSIIYGTSFAHDSGWIS